MFEILSLIAVGLIAGAIAAALGLGGGIIFVPSLVVLFGLEQHVAQGTSLAVILPTAIVATIAHARMGSIRTAIAVPIGLAGIVGAIIGGASLSNSTPTCSAGCSGSSSSFSRCAWHGVPGRSTTNRSVHSTRREQRASRGLIAEI